MADSFFELKGKPAVFADDKAFFALTEDRAGTEIKDGLYSPERLASPISPIKWRIRGKMFSNVSLSKTSIENIEFQYCTFNNCLLMGSTFINCRFTDCTFTSCNVHRIELQNVFVHPKSFSRCMPNKRYANIGVHLFHELLRNSRMQAQPDHADEAQYMFRRWQRFLNEDEFGEVPFWRKPQKAAAILGAWAFEFFLGSGVRLRNLAGTAAALLLTLTSIHWKFRQELGLDGAETRIHSFWDAFYFTAITITTLGYGDITPTTEVGRIVVAAEALIGFVLLATLASTVFRKFSS